MKMQRKTMKKTLGESVGGFSLGANFCLVPPPLDARFEYLYFAFILRREYKANPMVTAEIKGGRKRKRDRVGKRSSRRDRQGGTAERVDWLCLWGVAPGRKALVERVELTCAPQWAAAQCKLLLLLLPGPMSSALWPRLTGPAPRIDSAAVCISQANEMKRVL